MMFYAIRAAGLILCFLLPVGLSAHWVNAAGDRLEHLNSPEVPLAAAADEGYCSPALKTILRRVLQSCGLLGSGSGRGCQPVQAKNVATMSGEDFNALFQPMQERGGIVQFDRDDAELDPSDVSLIDEVFAAHGGASYFFVVARASPDGEVSHNRELSKARSEAVLDHLRKKFHDPDLDREVGLLWLGEEFAQLDPQFCAWRRSGDAATCEAEDINRSAFIAWIDCRL
ncbi:MAG TPA: hypothetical protein VFG83_01595 [Kofleriaceae bacterium]|nr:hypothetical protein [Kofleriaceae bacterium]